MADAVKYLRKLKRLSLDELRVRGTQKVMKLMERTGWSSLTKLPDDHSMLAQGSAHVEDRMISAQQLLDGFRSCTKPSFFPGLADKAATVRELRERWSHAEPGILERADRILEGRFDLLGLQALSFGDPVDWHLEPIAGKRAPRD